MAAALIGTDRRPVEAVVPEGAPAGLERALAERGAEDRLLSAAAAWTVARRAGALAREPVTVEPAEPMPARSRRARSCGRCSKARSPRCSGSGSRWRRSAGCGRRRSSSPSCSITRSTTHGCTPPRARRRGRSAAGWRSARRAGRSCAGPATTSRPCGPTASARSAARCWSACAAPTRRPRASCSPRTFAEETWEDRAAFVAALAVGALRARRAAARDRARRPPQAGPRRRRRAARRGSRARASPRGWRPARRRCCGSRTARLVAALPGHTGRVGRSATACPREAAAPSACAAARGDAARDVDGGAARRRAAPASEAAGESAGGDARRAASTARAASPPPLAATPADLVALPVADDLAEIVHAGWVAGGDRAARRGVGAGAVGRPARPGAPAARSPHDEAQRIAAAAPEPDVAARALPAAVGAGALAGGDRARSSGGARRASAGRTWRSPGTGSTRRCAEAAEERLRDLGGRDLWVLCDILAARAAMLRELS